MSNVLPIKKRFQRYAEKRNELDERFQFEFQLANVDLEDPRPDAERIRRTLALNDMDFKLMSDLHRGVMMMMLCAGHQISLEAPLDTQFLYAMQRVSDYHAGRVMTSDEEVHRQGAMLHAWACVRRTLDEIDEERRLARTQQNQPRRDRTADLKFAGAIEELLLQAAAGTLKRKGKARAKLISQILFDMQNEVHVNCDHPKVVKAYVLAALEKLALVEDRKSLSDLGQWDYDSAQNAFSEVRELLAGEYSERRFKEIDRRVNHGLRAAKAS